MFCGANSCRWAETCPTVNGKTLLRGAEASSSQFLSGWHLDDPDASLWSLQSGTLLLRNPGPGSCLLLSGLLPPGTHHGENTLTVECDGRSLGVVRNCSSQPVEFGFRSLIPDSTRDLRHIRIRIEHTYCPAESGVSPDKRRLGFALFCISAVRIWGVERAKARWADFTRRSRSAMGRLLFDSLPRWFEALGNRFGNVPLPDAMPGSGLSVMLMHTGDRAAVDVCRKEIESVVKHLGEPHEIIGGGGRRELRVGLKSAKYPWVYLLASDYTLDEKALREVLRWRAPHVFAVGSSIGDSGGGWMRVRLDQGMPKLEEHTVDTPSLARGAICLKPGTALYRTALLRRLCRAGDGYSSLDWSCLKWSVRSWKMGFETISCTGSRVHVARRFQSPDQVGPEADAARFLVRNSLPHAAGLRVVAGRSRGIPSRARAIGSCYATRFREGGYRYNRLPLGQVHQSYCITPRSSSKPDLVFVSPYVVFPPSHGSAVGMEHLLRALRERYTVHLVSDEASAYGTDSVPYFSALATVRLLSGRKDTAARRHSRIARIKSHSHAALKETLRLVIAAYQPAKVPAAIWISGFPRSSPAKRFQISPHRSEGFSSTSSTGGDWSCWMKERNTS
jgi:hypothetical protein